MSEKINKNLYQILEINKNADTQTIKQAYKRLALKYHPDKNKSKDANEIFNHMKIAYDILSVEESKNKYDSLDDTQHDTLLNMIYNFVKSLMEPETMKKLIQKIFNEDVNIMEYLNPAQNNIPNYDILKERIDKRLQDHLDLEIITQYVTKLNAEYTDKQEELSFYRPGEALLANSDKYVTVLREKNYKLMASISNSNEKSMYSECSRDTVPVTSVSNMIGSTNIHCEIKTNLDEIYNNNHNKIVVKRQIINNNDVAYKQYEYEVELNEDTFIFEGQGDNYYDAHNNIKSGDLIINIKCKQHQYFKRVNEYDILVNLPLTLCELFSGFNKTFDYFGNQRIKIMMLNSFGKITSDYKILKQLPFDGDKLVVVMSNMGLPKISAHSSILPEQESRGKLIIFLMLLKKEKFDEKIRLI